MAQQYIDFGAFPDDPDADAIRTAFQKVQNNFSELYATTILGSVVTVNNTPGAGISVSSPTGNVVVSATLACVQVRTSTLSVGIGSNGGTTAILSNTSQQLYIDVPPTLSTGNLSLTGNSSVTGNSNVGGNLIVTGYANVGSNLSVVGALNVTGNSNVGNITAGNSISANFFTGTLTTNAQPNITSVGTLTSLGVAGNITSGNANLGNLVTANYFSGDGYLLSNLSVSAGNKIEGGTSNVIVVTNSNVNTSVGGVANVHVVTSTGVNVAGTLNVTGDTTLANVVIGNLVSPLSNGTSNLNIPAASGNINLSVAGTANVLIVKSTGVNVAGTLDSSGNITGSNLITAGQLISTIATGTAPLSVSSTTKVANLNADLLDGYTTDSAATPNTVVIRDANGSFSANVITANLSGNATTAGTVTTATQPNITGVGVLSTLSVSGNANVGNIGASNGVFTNVSGDGSGLSNIAGGNVTGTVANATYATNAGLATTATTATSATTAGTVTTNAQPNITSVGTLSALAVTANVVAGNVYANSGTIKGAYLAGDGWQISNISVAAGSFIVNGTSNVSVDLNGNVNTSVAGVSNVQVVTSTGVNVAGTLNVTGNANVGNIGATGVISTRLTGSLTTASQPNVTSVGTLTGLTVSGLTNLGPNGNVTITGGVNGAFLRTNGSGSLTWDTATLVPAQGANTQVIFNDGGSTYAGNANLTFNKTTGALTVGGNIISVNANLGNLATANFFTGKFATAASSQPNITEVGTLSYLIVSGNINAGNIIGNIFGNVSSSGNITSGNVITTGYHIRSVNTGISAAGTVQGNATPLTKEINIVSTVSTGQGVVLPTAVAGMVINIVNTSANSLLVYPASSAIINSQAANAALTMPTSSSLQFIASSSTQWYTVGATYA